jgi:hypothetical protein
MELRAVVSRDRSDGNLSRSDGNLIFHDAAGKPVASAQLELPEQIPAVGGEFEGVCELLWSNEDFPAGGMESGRYKATVYDEWISFDLNPGWADNNVYFHGNFDGSELRGPWGHATFAGGFEQGEVVLRREDAP